jgi:hypothetical protein
MKFNWKWLLFIFSVIVSIIGIVIYCNSPIQHFLSAAIAQFNHKLISDTSIAVMKENGFTLFENGAVLSCFIFLIITFPLFKTKLLTVPKNGPEDISYRNNVKKNFLIWFLSCLFSLAGYLILAFLLFLFYHPSTNPGSEYLSKMAVMIKSLTFYMKSGERSLLMLGLITIPLFLFIFYTRLNTYIRNKDQKKIDFLYSKISPFSIILILLLVFTGFIVQDPFGSSSNGQFYFKQSLLMHHILFYSLLIFPIILALFLFPLKIMDKWKMLIGNALYRLEFIYIILLILTSVFINIFFYPSAPKAFHFEAVYYSISQLYQGIPLLTDHLNNTYGLYPYLLNPYFKLFGLNGLSFSIIMGLLMGFSYVFLFLFMKRIIKNKNILFLSFTTLFFLGYLSFKIITQDYYFQYHPLRFFFPCLLLYLSSLYLENKSRIIYYLAYVLSSIAILWNIDSGIIVFFSFFLVNCFLEINKRDLKQKVIGITRQILTALIILTATIGVFLLIIKLFYGIYPDLSGMFAMVDLAKMGFAMLPMPIIHPWNLTILIYISGLLYAASAFINKKADNQAILIFAVSIIGIGSFSYYEGRSHNYNLCNVWSYSFILMAFFAEKLQKIFLKSRLKTALILFAILIYFLSFSFIDILVNAKNTGDLAFKRNYIWNRKAESPFIDNINLIKKYTKPGEKVVIFSMGYEGLCLTECGLKSAYNPGFIELFTKSDYDRLLKLVNESDYKIFWSIDYTRLSDKNLELILKNKYNKIADNGHLIYYQKKTGK